MVPTVGAPHDGQPLAGAYPDAQPHGAAQAGSQVGAHVGYRGRSPRNNSHDSQPQIASVSIDAAVNIITFRILMFPSNQSAICSGIKVFFQPARDQLRN
jgi:hypothetical protein